MDFTLAAGNMQEWLCLARRLCQITALIWMINARKERYFIALQFRSELVSLFVFGL